MLTGCQWSPRKITIPVLPWQEALKGWFLSPPFLSCIRMISPTVRECIQRHDLGLEIMRCLSCTLLFNHLPKKGTIYCFWYFSSRLISDFKSSRSSLILCTEENKVASEDRIFGSNFLKEGPSETEKHLELPCGQWHPLSLQDRVALLIITYAILVLKNLQNSPVGGS